MTKRKDPPVKPERRGVKGRPRLVPDLEVVKGLASQGLNAMQIAEALGISYSTLKCRRRESAEFDAAILEGNAQGVVTVTNALFRMATVEGNVAAAIFYLKNRAGWKDKVEVEGGVVLPAPLVIQVEAQPAIKDVTPKPEMLEAKA